jgi:formimidoylglutamase
MNPAEHLRDIVIEPASQLFYSRNDSEDPRMGDLVIRRLEGYVPEVNIGIIGCPQDEGVRRNKGRTGAQAAPTEIRRAFYKLTPFALKPETSPLRIFDFGDIREANSLEEVHEQLSYAVETMTSCGITPIVLGGGHDIAYADFMGLAEHASSLGVVNIDAHLDYRKPVPERNSGTSFRQMLDEPSGKLKPENFVEFAIQPYVNSATHFRELFERGVRIVPLEQIAQDGIRDMFTNALKAASNGTDAVMVSFDIDAVRSGDAPGVSSPSTIGLQGEQMAELALMAGKHPSVKLIDIVEVNPFFDVDGRTAKLAALVMMNFLTGFLQR